MKVFISWSGEKSKAVATKLHEMLPDIINYVETWLSSEDIDAGARWNKKIAKELSETKFGIICLTKSNPEAPWLVFEAGALAKTIDDNTFVCPYLIDMEPSDIPKGPLTQFQWKKANEDGTLELIETINKALGEDSLPDDRLKRTFNKFWTDLNDILQDLPDEADTEEEKRPQEEMIEEILDVVRSMSRRSTKQDIISSIRMGLQSKLYDSIDEGDNSTTAIPTPSASDRLVGLKLREALRIASSADKKVGLGLHRPEHLKSESDSGNGK